MLVDDVRLLLLLLLQILVENYARPLLMRWRSVRPLLLLLLLLLLLFTFLLHGAESFLRS